jgi:hypothetical protein
MASLPARKLHAYDVLNWDYLVELSCNYDPDAPRSLTAALAKLAYDLTQTGDEEIRSLELSEFLHALTDHTSTAAAEEMLACVAMHLRCELKKMREFAKENGVKLKRLKLW